MRPNVQYAMSGTARAGIVILLSLVASRADSQTITTLLSFSGTSGTTLGANPYGSLTLSGSTLYGTTYSGGTYNDGTVFSIPVSGGTPTILLSFNGKNGAEPACGLTLSGSTLYGTTDNEGPNATPGSPDSGPGIVFSLPVSGGTPTTLYYFGGTGGGANPVCGLTLSGSTLYGTTQDGGTYNDGTVFSLPVTGGSLTTLFSFNGKNGAEPVGNLTLSASTLYGTTPHGGVNYDGTHYYTGDGTVFSVPVNGGTPTTLLSFSGSNGEYANEVLLNGSTLYGSTQAGGANGYGTVFSVSDTGGGSTTLLSFNNKDGASPICGLTLGGTVLYGMIESGGSLGDGNVFSVPLSGGTPTALFSFNVNYGYDPFADLTVSGSTLYGTTFGGGAYSDGIVFSLNLSPTPEPSTLGLAVVGAIGLAIRGLCAAGVARRENKGGE